MRGIFKAVGAALLLACAPLCEAHSVKRNPLKSVSGVDNPIIHTPSHRVHAHSSFDISFDLSDRQQKIRLSLEPNHDIIPDTASVSYLDQDGSPVRLEKIERADHKVFRGHAFIEHPSYSEWVKTGFARITIHHDGAKPVFEGVFRINGNHHHIQTSSHFRQMRHDSDPTIPVEDDEYMIVWRDSDITPHLRDAYGELRRDVDVADTGCSSDKLLFNQDPNHPVRRGSSRLPSDMSAIPKSSLFGRQDVPGGNGPAVNLENNIGSTSGCPDTRKVALLGIAVDCTYRQQFDSEAEMRRNVLSVVNSASGLYEETFNISLGLANLTVTDPNDNQPECPGTPPANSPWNQDCTPDVDIFERLNLFSEWRGQWNDGNAFWTLLTTCESGSAVGLAWLGQLCASGSTSQGGENGETFAGANVVVRTDTEWQVFAHEVGHTFGAVHDCTSETCSNGDVERQQCCPVSSGSCNANGQFMMNPSTSEGITQFSPCSVGNICSGMGVGNVDDSCLTDNRNIVTITEAQCGNGIVEQGEDCDCGGEELCTGNSCCDPTTCKFVGDAVCDTANEDCCTDQCQFASSGTVCRESTSSCDPSETCPGNAATCPEDRKADNGQSCGGDGSGLACASGQCTSRDLQCQSVVGSMGNNDTSACNPEQCILACTSPTFGDEQCYNMQQYFLNGTPCGSGGTCRNGSCEGSNVVNDFLQLLRDNKDIAIPVGASVGGFIVLLILWCCISSCRRRSRRRRIAAKVANGPAPPPLQPPPPGPRRSRGPAGGAAWSANSSVRSPPSVASRGPPPPGMDGYPPPPFPSMSGPHGPHGHVPTNPSMSGSRLWQDDGPQQWAPSRRMSTRYA